MCSKLIPYFFTDIQEFYELTLLDENKSVQEKTAETLRIASKWESNEGLIIPKYSSNDVSITPFLLPITCYSSP